MKGSKFSDAQKAFILKQAADGVPVAETCRKAGLSQATFFNWKKKYDGLLPPEMRRLKQLEDENAKLKKIVAELSLDKEMLQDVLRRNCKACPQAQAGRFIVCRLARIDPESLPSSSVRYLELPLQSPPARPGRY